MKVIITFPTSRMEAEIFDTPTGRAIYNALPLRRNVNTWGDEIYFEIPVQSELETGARAEVSVGDLAYWPNMPAFCIFFGPTPVSNGSQPVAASRVNVFGKIPDVNPELLRRIANGVNVSVERLN
jgi:hypothetical protein